MGSLYPPRLPQPIHNPAGYMHKIVIFLRHPAFPRTLPHAPRLAFRHKSAEKANIFGLFRAGKARNRPLFPPSSPHRAPHTGKSTHFCACDGARVFCPPEGRRNADLPRGKSPFAPPARQTAASARRVGLHPRRIASRKRGVSGARPNPMEATAAREALPHPPFLIIQ